MNPRDRSEKASKFLSYVLRHAPQEVGLTLDTGGWVDIEALLQAAQRAEVALDRVLFDAVVAGSDKKRFTISPDGRRVRAAQGHSVPVDLGLVPVAPPDVLYHGTAERFLPAILVEGLRPMARQHVHLSADEATAEAVGRRHGKPIVLLVDSAGLQAQGQAFYQAENGVWLTSPVSAAYLTRR